MDFEALYEIVEKAICDAGTMRFVYLDQQTAGDILTILGNCRDGLNPNYSGTIDPRETHTEIDLGLEGDEHVRQQ